MSNATRTLLLERRVIICCGAGGVGKTSVSAALALFGARLGRRVLVVTIDPSRRLAQVLGVSRNTPSPVLLAPEVLREGGVREGGGSLSAWMLDPKRVADEMVLKMTGARHATFLSNRIYRHATEMIAGMQEYTAVEALSRFVQEGLYDLIVLDTPPSRNALQFLDAPNRMQGFLDSKMFHLFAGSPGTPLRRAARRVLDTIMDAALGHELRQEFQSFLNLFADILAQTNRDATVIHDFMKSPDVALLWVTSPNPAVLRELFFFETRVRDQLGLHLAGFFLNRSFVDHRVHRVHPRDVVNEQPSDVTRSGLKKLAQLADDELREIDAHQRIQAMVSERLGKEKLALALPYFSDGISDMASLNALTDALAS